jgi:hypothetical protein
VANVLTITLTLFSLIVAILAFNYARQSGAQQSAILESQRTTLVDSQRALASVVGQLDDQRRLLDETLKTSTNHLTLVRDAYEAERKRLARRPEIRIGIGTMSEAEIEHPLPLPIEADNFARIDIMLENIGDADLRRPTVIVRAAPGGQGIYFEPRRVRSGEQRNPFQFSGPNVQDIRPMSVAKVKTKFEVDVHVPPAVNAFDIEVRVFGEDAPAVTRMLHFAPTRGKP